MIPQPTRPKSPAHPCRITVDQHQHFQRSLRTDHRGVDEIDRQIDDHRVAQLWDEQEQARHDELSSNPVLDRIPARKPKGKLGSLLKALDSLEQGGIR
jgi:hypothetical protein